MHMPPTTLLSSLPLDSCPLLALAGGKAATLATLRAAGCPVPDGVVLPAATTARLVHEGDDGTALTFLEQLLGSVPRGPWAVRSSAVAEDTAEASFAGQYQTVLGVGTAQEVLGAVRACATSGESSRARTYLAASGVGTGRDTTIPVLIMPMVDARAAGVAFSSDPVTGDDRTVVSAIPGLGDRLVDGTVTPDQWFVGRDDAIISRDVSHQALTDGEVSAVAALTATVRDALGHPVDIEWAIDTEGRLVLLQARPITALPTPPVQDWGSGVWSKDVAHYPQQMTPFGASTFTASMQPTITGMATDWGMILKRYTEVVVGGEVYAQVVPLGPEPTGKPSPPPPAVVMGILARVVPSFRARMRTARRRLEAGDLDTVVTRWHDEWKPEMRANAERLLAADPDALDATALRVHLDEALAHMRRGSWIHFELVPTYMIRMHEFVTACETHLGMSELEAIEVLRGASATSSEPARTLAALGIRVRSSPAALAQLEATGADLARRLGAIDASLGADVADWLHRYGWRTNNYDCGAPALAEQPAVFAALLRSAGTSTDDGAAETDARGDTGSALAAVRARLSTCPRRIRRAVEPTIEPALATYGLREDNSFWCDVMSAGIVRRALSAAGRRLAAAGSLAHADDASWLEVDEVRSSLEARPAGVSGPHELRALVRQRRAEYAWTAAHPGPMTVGGDDGPRPDLRYLPAAGRRVNQALMWLLSQEHPDEVAQSEGADLIGRAGSAGSYRGRVRVIFDEAALADLEPGEVLVCPVTTPAWSPVFAVAGALITDHGGMLSHAAIVARENGLPAVVGAPRATTRLRTGMEVTVNGTAGTVTIHEPV